MKPVKRSDSGWLFPAALLVGAVTVLRLAALAFNGTDLFVDESQYWLWGQTLDFGYYSKPPLIAWVIRAVTDLAGSDAAFWVRMPGAIFHGVTALILAALAARLYGARVAVWVAASYVTLPMVAVGSLLISTDTIMAPFFAAALLFHFIAVDSGKARFAALAGAAAGLAFLAKYAAVYFLLGAGLAALISPAMRLPWRAVGAMLLAFGLVILPNILWNLGHDLATVEHTMDNVGWLRGGAALNLGGLAGFFGAQFAVFGPVLFGALLWRALRSAPGVERALLAFVLPVLAVVCVQALLEKAYANWAVAAYFGGVLVVVPALVARAPRLLWLSLAVNGAIALALPLLTLMPEARFGRDAPLLERYLGRADLSRQIIAAAQAAGGVPVLVENRDLLADLFYTGAGTGLAFHAPRPEGRPRNFYEQTHPLPDDLRGPLLLVSEAAPVCLGAPLAPVVRFDTAGGAHARKSLAGYLLSEDCRDARP
ncbi:glycosyltransferase family 39 protein [Paracoccaceae bacterium Fryx2]|nr:glycosyltransferase family 39 protein [Paracoccaceae bacterium Fryx2]